MSHRPTAAEQAVPAEERVASLRREGKTDVEITLALGAERYNIAEMMRALHCNARQLKQLREGFEGRRRGVLIEGREQLSRIEPLQDRVRGEGERRNPARQMKRDEIGYEPQSVGGAVLKTVLRDDSGINAAMAAAVLKFYEAHREVFEANPVPLIGVLRGAGLTWRRAQEFVGDWLMQVDPDAFFAPYLAGPRGAPGWMTPDAAPREHKPSFKERLDAITDRVMDKAWEMQMARMTGR